MECEEGIVRNYFFASNYQKMGSIIGFERLIQRLKLIK